MPKKGHRQFGRNGSHRGGGGGFTGGARRMGYQQTVKASANLVYTASTTGASFWGVGGFGAGSGTYLTPYYTATNYATLSQWGDFRLQKIILTFIAQVGSAGDPIQVVSALDSTCGDLAGSASATGAFSTILSRQSVKKSVVTPSQQRPISHVWRPVEVQNRLWSDQASLSVAGVPAASVGNWGVLVACFCPASSTSVNIYVDWYFDVREPTLSGVLIGNETKEARERLARLVERSLAPGSAIGIRLRP